jgi:predicted ATPase
LAVFGDLARKVELLYQISRQRLKFKRLSIDKAEGLTVSARDPATPGGYSRHLRLSDLSSGEQHHLVLLTKLLFDVPSNSLVLIDEPEISMHIVWQHELLNDLKKIADIIDADLLIATHSPQIIGDFADQAIPLDEQVRLEE